MTKTHEQLMIELRHAKEKQDAVLSRQVLMELNKIHVVDPLDPCIDVANMKLIVGAHTAEVLAWACVPKAMRAAGMEALVRGGNAVSSHVEATDGRKTVMHLTGLALAGQSASHYIWFFQTAMSTKPKDKKIVREAVHGLMVREQHVWHLHAIGKALAEVNDSAGLRASLVQIALMATIKAKGPRNDDVQDLVQQMTEIHGAAAAEQLSVQVMNPLVWTAELESHNNLHMA
ncbi:hypothetical protein [Burkholderia gladioli]|uniref:hypothetical protein n=1 Tax=Burkholderia gladioli TaxID=28095 RepID=UPI00163E7C1D|nr:hypothetical protein [Burkholderia gladioli]